MEKIEPETEEIIPYVCAAHAGMDRLIKSQTEELRWIRRLLIVLIMTVLGTGAM